MNITPVISGITKTPSLGITTNPLICNNIRGFFNDYKGLGEGEEWYITSLPYSTLEYVLLDIVYYTRLSVHFYFEWATVSHTRQVAAHNYFTARCSVMA